MSTSTRRLLAIPKSFCIIDPHVHYWTPQHFSWLEGLRTSGDWKANSGREFLPSTYLEETRPLNIEQTVHIQANWTGEDCVGETEWEQQLAGKKRNMGHPHAICSYAPMHRPQEAEEILERHFAYPNFRGIRFMLDFDQNTPEMCQTDRDYINDPEFLSGMKLLNDYQGQIFELQVCQSQLTRAAELVSKFPDLNFILNHAGFPLSGEEKRVQWLEGINAVAQNENAYVKISALGMWEGGWSGVDKITGTIEDTLLAFGPNRSMFASNLPIDKEVTGDAVGIFDDFYRAAKGKLKLKMQDIEALFFHNASILYKLHCKHGGNLRDNNAPEVWGGYGVLDDKNNR